MKSHGERCDPLAVDGVGGCGEAISTMIRLGAEHTLGQLPGGLKAVSIAEAVVQVGEAAHLSER